MMDFPVSFPITVRFLRNLAAIAAFEMALLVSPLQGGESPGARFVPQDVEFAHPAYSTEFDGPTVLDDWVLEGEAKAEVADGNLLLENGSDSGKKSGHLVFWLKPQMPGDFLLEFTFRPENRKEGLAIVFFNARGKNGESIFDPNLAPRNGVFRQYHSGDINNYHVSYWSGSTRTRGQGPSAHIRKNLGFNIVAEGEDLVVNGKDDAFQTIRIYKRGRNIRVMVDDIIAATYDDDGKTYGPVHDFPGWIGLRQMVHTRKAEYGRLAVYPLK